MANRDQRRNAKKLMNKPELKKYVDKFCMEMSTILVDNCEQAKNVSEKTGKPINYEAIQLEIQKAMEKQGEELGHHVKSAIQQYKTPNKAPIRTNLRARAN